MDIPKNDFDPKKWVGSFFSKKEGWTKIDDVWTDDYTEVYFREENGGLFLEAWNIEVTSFLWIRIPVVRDSRDIPFLYNVLKKIA
ncbi:MAG: hypothetical protein AAF731_07725 [Bacteroidota bacterium]